LHKEPGHRPPDPAGSACDDDVLILKT